MRSSGAVTAWMQAVAANQRSCDPFFDGHYAPNNKIAYSVVVQLNDSAQASNAFGLGPPQYGFNLFGQFGASAPGAVTGSQTGLGPNSLAVASTEHNDWNAFWQHSSFLVEFAASNCGFRGVRADKRPASSS